MEGTRDWGLGEKPQISNPKSQTNPKFKAEIFKTVWTFGPFDFEFVWNLCFGS
jgi:hypothetical protein